MKLLYEASNSIEGHMILNLVEQSGLSARIDGEYLQGGVGELQAMGIVRVMVEENDYVEARKIVQAWDARQPKQEVQRQVSQKNKVSFGAAFLGFIGGVVAMAVYYHTPITYGGIDYNGDGEIDEKWTYVNYNISKIEGDRNFDGEIDTIHLYDRKGIIESSSLDEDLDGIFETELVYDTGYVEWQKSDTTGDGFKNYKINFKHGAVDTIRFIDPVTKKTIKVQEYGPFLIRKAQVDTTGNGLLDTVHEYDSLEEISSTSRK